MAEHHEVTRSPGEHVSSTDTFAAPAESVARLDGPQAVNAHSYLAAIVESSDDAILSKGSQRHHPIVQCGQRRGSSAIPHRSSSVNQYAILIPPERQSEEDEILARIRRGERVEHFETVRVSKDHRRIDVSLTISPVRDASGSVDWRRPRSRAISATRSAPAPSMRIWRRSSSRPKTRFSRRTSTASSNHAMPPPSACSATPPPS